MQGGLTLALALFEMPMIVIGNLNYSLRERVTDRYDENVNLSLIVTV